VSQNYKHLFFTRYSNCYVAMLWMHQFAFQIFTFSIRIIQ